MLVLQIILCLLVLIAIVLIIVFRTKAIDSVADLPDQFDGLFKLLDKITDNFKDDFRTNREESAAIATQNRRELSDTLLKFKTEMTETLRLITEQNKWGNEQIFTI